VSGFGRKGAGAAVATAAGPAPAIDPDLAARRAAFLEQERARPREAEPGRVVEGNFRAPNIREKSLARAYWLWFFMGGFSAHRFYLGCPTSGAIQASFLPINWALFVSGSWYFMLTAMVGGLWILADAFIIPSLHREANGRIRNAAVGAVFA